jgi:broad specificity phosphatase PhoE
MHLLLTRHGQSVFNRDGLSPVDSPLTELGCEQARQLGAWLAGHETPTGFYASTLRRAHQTAEIINGFLQMAVSFLDDLREAEEYPLPHVPRQSNPLAPLGASLPDETYQAFRARIERAAALIMDAHPDGKVLVVAHGGSLGVMIRLLLGAPTALISTDNCALHKLSWHAPQVDARLGGHWIVHYLNQRAHLDPKG